MILVTGATGTNGIEIIKRLSGRGVAVRAIVHREGSFPKPELPGVEEVAADFDDLQSIKPALKGIERAFLVTNSSRKVEAQQLAFIQAARDAGVSHIVYLSQLRASKDSPVRFLRYHAVVEQALSESGLMFTNLRPNLYMQGLLMFKQMIRSEGRFFAPAGDASISVVDVRDIADVAVAALTEAGHEGKAYELTGPEALTHTAMAAQLSEAFEKPITFEDIPGEAMRKQLLGFQVDEWQADGLVEDYGHYRSGEASAISSAVKDVTGQPPIPFAQFARNYKQAFLDN